MRLDILLWDVLKDIKNLKITQVVIDASSMNNMFVSSWKLKTTNLWFATATWYSHESFMDHWITMKFPIKHVSLAAQSHYQQDIQIGRSLYETGMMAIELQAGFNKGIMNYYPGRKNMYQKKTYHNKIYCWLLLSWYVFLKDMLTKYKHTTSVSHVGPCYLELSWDWDPGTLDVPAWMTGPCRESSNLRFTTICHTISLLQNIVSRCK